MGIKDFFQKNKSKNRKRTYEQTPTSNKLVLSNKRKYKVVMNTESDTFDDNFKTKYGKISISKNKKISDSFVYDTSTGDAKRNYKKINYKRGVKKTVTSTDNHDDYGNLNKSSSRSVKETPKKTVIKTSGFDYDGNSYKTRKKYGK
jgi:hypothetical protein